MPSLTPHPSSIGQICHICPERALSWLGGAAQRPFPGACGRPGGGSPGYSLAPRASAPSLRVAHSAAPAAAAVYSSGGCVPRVEPGHHSGYSVFLWKWRYLGKQVGVASRRRETVVRGPWGAACSASHSRRRHFALPTRSAGVAGPVLWVAAGGGESG